MEGIMLGMETHILINWEQSKPGTYSFNTLRPRQNGRHFADDTFKPIFLNENIRISIKISLKFVPNVPINNIPALVQIMAWRRPGDKPLSEPMMVKLRTHICVTRPQRINDFPIIIQIRWKFHLTVIQLLVTILQQNVAHTTTVQVSCYEQNFVAIILLQFGWEQNENSITFELWWKIVSERGHST